MLALPRRIPLAALLLCVTSTATAQRGATPADSGAGRAGQLPLTPTRPLKFTTDEGTWLALDLSADGRTIVFDLLGDLYTLPIAGGHATRITSGQGFDVAPHFAPDGQTIVFVSDRSGSDNLWLVRADGTGLRQLTRESDRTFVSPTFTADGKYVVVSKSQRFSGGQFDLYMYYLEGGTGLRLTGEAAGATGGPPATPAGGPANFVGPAVSPDGRYIYTAVRTAGSGALPYQVAAFDRTSGRTFVKTYAVGGAVRPVVSPDGQSLAFASRDGAETGLKLRDLATGDERWLVKSIQRDNQESNPTTDLLPPYAFTPDSRAIIIAHHGYIWRVSLADGRETRIPFTAEVDQMIAGQIKEQYPFNDSTLTVHQVRDGQASPDNRRFVFTALDRLWVMDLPGGTPRRLNPQGQVGEFHPTWSPDGQFVAYVTWNDVSGGDVYRVRADGRGQPERLTTQSAYYEKAAYSPDGRRIVVGRGPRGMRRDRGEGPDASATTARSIGVELVWLPAHGGAATVIAPMEGVGRPHFVIGDTTRIYVSEAGALVSLRWDGTDRKTILRDASAGSGGAGTAGGGDGTMTLSPDGQRLLVQSGVHVFLVQAVPMTGNPPAINATTPAQSQVPVRKLTTHGGEFASWSPDGKQVYFSLARTLFTYDIAAAEAAQRDSLVRADSTGRGGSPGGSAGGAARPIYEPARYDVTITVPRDKPSGSVVLRGARIITMRGAEIIPRGDIVVTDNRIVAVGPQGRVTVPAGARVIDVAGKTIIPGYVDIHAHILPAFGVHRSQPSEYLANLAYGVTTTRDVQTSRTDGMSYEDQVETGEFIGPRIFSTGPGIFAAENIRSLEDARTVLTRYAQFYRRMTVKQYMTGDRRVRQLFVMAARELKLMPTLEGGGDFKKNITEAMDGYSGIEHTMPLAPLAKDVIQLMAVAGVTYTPTLLVQYGGPGSENHWFATTEVLNDPKVNRFTPPETVQRKALRRTGWTHEEAYSYPLFAAQLAKIVAAGGRVGMGSHGEIHGIGAHWEIWSMASGGMPRHDVLRVSTLFGAEAIGLEQHLGSIEAGKLADLQVLDRNPLDDIRNTNTIRYVMKNGRLYEGDTLNEIWPRQRAVPRLWWWTEGGNAKQN